MPLIGEKLSFSGIIAELSTGYEKDMKPKLLIPTEKASRILAYFHQKGRSFNLADQNYIHNGEAVEGFVEWTANVIEFLEEAFTTIDVSGRFSESTDLADIKKNNGALDEIGHYYARVKARTDFIENLIATLPLYTVDESSKPNTIETIELLFSRFHVVARQIRHRHDNRNTIDVKDEYDVQDLLHALLRIHYQDVREEEGTPTYAGGASRIDFLLKEEQILIEVKKTRRTLKAKEVGEQLIIDIARYKTHPDCKMLYCFVYDPEGYIKNPKGIENDLSNSDGPFPVKVFIAPK